MIRWLPSLLILVGLASAQDPPSPPLVAKKATEETMSAVTSSAVRPKYATRALSAPDVPAAPGGKASLVGGTIKSVDLIRDSLVLQIFQGGRIPVLFDERTRVFLDGTIASLDALKKGERAYVDTTLDGTQVFARNIRIAAGGLSGQSNGQIVSFRPETGELLVRDTISPDPVKMRLADNATILLGDRISEPSEIRPGTLVSLAFTAGNGKAPVVHQISILASPGTAYVFSGQIEGLDLHRGLLVLVDPRDHKSYDIYFDPTVRIQTQDLKLGANVTVQTGFDGKRYQSSAITVNTVRTPQ